MMTRAELDTVTPVWDCQRGQMIYLAQSDSDPRHEYHVRWVAPTVNTAGRWTCTCQSGQVGFANCRYHKHCKHVRRVQAYLEWERSTVTA